MKAGEDEIKNQSFFTNWEKRSFFYFQRIEVQNTGFLTSTQKFQHLANISRIYVHVYKHKIIDKQHWSTQQRAAMSIPKPKAKTRMMANPPVAGTLKPVVKSANEEAREQGYHYAVMMTESAHLYCCYCGAVSSIRSHCCIYRCTRLRRRIRWRWRILRLW